MQGQSFFASQQLLTHTAEMCENVGELQMHVSPPVIMLNHIGGAGAI